MNISLWIGLSFFLILEGLGPMLFPNAWRKIIHFIIKLPDRLLRRYGGALVVAGIVIYFMINRYI